MTPADYAEEGRRAPPGAQCPYEPGEVGYDYWQHGHSGRASAQLQGCVKAARNYQSPRSRELCRLIRGEKAEEE